MFVLRHSERQCETQYMSPTVVSSVRNISCFHPASLAECSLFSTILQTLWCQNMMAEWKDRVLCSPWSAGRVVEAITEQTLALAFPGTEWWGANTWNMENRVPSPLITCPCFYSLALISSAYHLLPSLGFSTRAGLSYIIVTIIYKPYSSFSSAPLLFPLVPGFINLFSF
jgi:hypothetical protein